MRNRKRMKRTTKQYITVATICVVVIGGAALTTSIIFAKQMRQEYELKISEIEQELLDAERQVFVASADIKRGEIITLDNVEEAIVHATSPQELYMTSQELGKASLIEITIGTHVTHGMLTDNVIAAELREVEYDIIHLSSNLENHDVVDVRIFFPNGEDFSILSKKLIKASPMELVECYLWLDEEEILRMQSAVIDAYLYPGTYLYTTKYIEPNIQTATIVTYEPSIESIHLIQESPNIVMTATNELSKLARKALENRLSSSMNKEVSKRQWDLDYDYIYQKKERDVLEDMENNKVNKPKETSRENEIKASDAHPSDAQKSGAQTSSSQINGVQTSDVQTSGTQTSGTQTSGAQTSDTQKGGSQKKDTKTSGSISQGDTLQEDEQRNSSNYPELGWYYEEDSGYETYFITEG